MSNAARPIFIRVPTLLVLSFLSSCAAASYDYCPRYPVAGPQVATELEKIPDGSLSAFWEWIGRINKLRQELELCRRNETQK